jgi:hypothetical protein
MLTDLGAAVLAVIRLVEPEQAAELGPGLIAFTVVALLAIATFFLIRSMLHHINKVPPTFDDEVGEAAGEQSDPDVGER